MPAFPNTRPCNKTGCPGKMWMKGYATERSSDSEKLLAVVRYECKICGHKVKVRKRIAQAVKNDKIEIVADYSDFSSPPVDSLPSSDLAALEEMHSKLSDLSLRSDTLLAETRSTSVSEVSDLAVSVRVARYLNGLNSEIHALMTEAWNLITELSESG